MNARRKAMLLVAAAAVLVLCAGCAAGTARFETSQAGFWAGLWHGLILVVTFIIGLFTDNVRMYEPNNVGALYDLGFLLGAIIVLGGSCRGKKSRRKPKFEITRDKEKEWEEIAERVEEKVRKGIRKWLDESEKGDEEWEEVGRKVEEKIKRELRKWSEE
jgi:hypothetical protein